MFAGFETEKKRFDSYVESLLYMFQILWMKLLNHNETWTRDVCKTDIPPSALLLETAIKVQEGRRRKWTCISTLSEGC